MFGGDEGDGEVEMWGTDDRKKQLQGCPVSGISRRLGDGSRCVKDCGDMGADAFGVFSDENPPQSILSCRLVSGSCPYHHSPLRTKNQSACALGKCRIPDSPAAAFFGHPVFEGRGGEETGGGEAQGGCACCAVRGSLWVMDGRW